MFDKQKAREVIGSLNNHRNNINQDSLTTTAFFTDEKEYIYLIKWMGKLAEKSEIEIKRLCDSCYK